MFKRQSNLSVHPIELPHEKLVQDSLSSERVGNSSDGEISRDSSPRGSPRGSRRAFYHITEAEKQAQAEYLDFVTKKFRIKECVKFVPKEDKLKKQSGPPRCHCGETKENHYRPSYGQNAGSSNSNQAGSSKLPDTEWTESQCIQNFPINAFGKIEFQNNIMGYSKPAKYMRVTEECVDEAIQLMIDQDKWNMFEPHKPSLVISVIGGAKNFKLAGRKKEVFNRGLVKAAKTTNAWIITSGCNMGVMKAVGDAVRDAQTYNWDSKHVTHSIRCIGIPPWGYLENRHRLVSHDGKGCFPARYKANTAIRHGQPVSLNPSHTHFLMVDNGKRNTYNLGQFKAKLENKLLTPEPEGLGLPVVLLILEGGYDALVDAKLSLDQRIPVVVCEGTGRAADILSFAFNYQQRDKHGKLCLPKKAEAMLKMKIREAFGDNWRSKATKSEEHTYVEMQVKHFAEMVQESCQDENLVTIFDTNRDEALDRAILSALLKIKGNSEEKQMLEQLTIAIKWNRCDIAEDKIFLNERIWTQGCLDEYMTIALKNNQIDFMRLLLQHGITMSEYLTVGRLEDLYRDSLSCNSKSAVMKELLHQVVGLQEMKEVKLSHISHVLKKLQVKHDASQYEDPAESSQPGPHIVMDDVHPSQVTFEKPLKELFLWAIFFNRQDMALYLWEGGEDVIVTALVGSMLYGKLAEKTDTRNNELEDAYLKNKDKFEMLAENVLEECYNADEEKALQLLERRYADWGQQNCLELAAAANCKAFLSTECCQNQLNQMWRGQVLSSSLKVFCTLMFPLLFFLIRWKKKGFKFHEKVLLFFKSPMVKFSIHLLWYIIFLVAYSYLILFDLREEVSTLEGVLIGWISTMLVEELREVTFSTSDGALNKIVDWWNFSVWNRIDMILSLLALAGFLFRMIPDMFDVMKLFYCMNCVVFFLRFLRLYSVSSVLGPKLVMIKLMVIELAIFVCILIVAIMGYGVTYQALTFPSRAPYWGILKDIFYYPYWQIYGELFLDEIGLQGPLPGCEGNSTVSSDGHPCPTFHSFVPVLLALYLLVGNVLLLNLLIAIFSFVFDKVQQNSLEIWKFDMYFLVMEYIDKPGLPPPFIIIEHIFLFFKFIARKTCCKKQTMASSKAIEHHRKLLGSFEKDSIKSFMRKSREKTELEPSELTLVMKRRVDGIAKCIEEMRLYWADTHKEVEDEDLGHADNMSVDNFSMFADATAARFRTLRERRLMEQTVDAFKYGLKPTDEPGIKMNDSQNITGLTPIEESENDNKLKKKKKHRRKERERKRDEKLSLSAEEENGSELKGEWSQKPRRRKKKFVDDENDKRTEEKQGRKSSRSKSPNPTSFAESTVSLMEKGQMPGATKSKSFTDSDKVLNVSPTDDRIQILEDRITSLEEKTTSSLSNIEDMLQKLVFSKGSNAK